MPRITTKSLATFALVSGLAVSTTGCFQGYDGVFIEADDVRMDVPGSDGQFRAENEQGDVQNLVAWTAQDVNAWVTAVVETSGYVVEFVNGHRETSKDGDWRVYGPHTSTNVGGNLAWIVKVKGDATDTSFEFLCAPGGSENEADFDLLIAGQLQAEDEMRQGHVDINFDTVEKYNELKDVNYALETYSGDIKIEFSRNTETGEKNIDLDFKDFLIERTGYLDDDSFYSDETYNYALEADGSGTFFLALNAEFDYWWTAGYGTWGGGSEMERLQLDAAWDADQAGRARGTIGSEEAPGDLPHGHLEIDECWGNDTYLVWRQINDNYVDFVETDYNFGDEGDCAFDADAF
jgi:hypothetical protein